MAKYFPKMQNTVNVKSQFRGNRGNFG